MVALDDEARAIYAQLVALEGRSLGVLGESFQDELLRTGKVAWKCRAGARFFHVCEDGLVHLCGPRFGAAPQPLTSYGVDDIRRAFAAPKACAATCPVAYAHMASRLDRLRGQRGAIDAATVTVAPAGDGRVHLRVVASAG